MQNGEATTNTFNYNFILLIISIYARGNALKISPRNVIKYLEQFKTSSRVRDKENEEHYPNPQFKMLTQSI